jgi:two-component system, NarL family, sensor kinase
MRTRRRSPTDPAIAGDAERERWIVARPVAQFALIGLAGLITVGIATLVASQRIGQREAITDVRTTALVRAQGLVEPAVTNTLATGDPAAVAAVGRAVEHGVIDATLVRVKIWTANGTIVYSNEPRLVGSTFQLEDDELAALHSGLITAGVSNLDKPENRYEVGYHKLLEVYLPIRSPNGQRLLFEAYFRFDVVSASANRIWRSFAPVSLGALIVLALIQIPLAYSLARRLRQRQEEREALLTQALDASDVERRRIAADLHDGVVQDLTGVTYNLAGAARERSTPPETAALLDDAAESVRASVTGLRSLLVELYPPDLGGESLATALSDLLGPVSDAGMTASYDSSALTQPLSTPVATLLYRAAREALRNVVAHAHASTVQVSVGADAEHAWLRITDDGIGVAPGMVESRAAEGHLGLRTLTDQVNGMDGRLRVKDGPAGGTVVELEVPLS